MRWLAGALGAVVFLGSGGATGGLLASSLTDPAKPVVRVVSPPRLNELGAEFRARVTVREEGLERRLAQSSTKLKRSKRALRKQDRVESRLRRKVDQLELRLMCASPSNSTQLGRCIQARGFRVSEHPAFGGATPGVHASNGHHYAPCSCALDVNADGNESAKLDELHAWLSGLAGVDQLIWRAPGHWTHLHVSMP